MISLRRLNSSEVFINPDLIRFVEATPDTVITFTDGLQIMVKDSPQDILNKIKELKKTYYTTDDAQSLRRGN